MVLRPFPLPRRHEIAKSTEHAIDMDINNVRGLAGDVFNRPLIATVKVVSTVSLKPTRQVLHLPQLFMP